MNDQTAETARLMKVAEAIVREMDRQGIAEAVADLGFDVAPVVRPKFYDLQTDEGVAYDKIAKLHGKNVLATTVVQTCVRYDESERCRFCAIEASLDAGTTIAVKTPAMLAEVAEAAGVPKRDLYAAALASRRS